MIKAIVVAFLIGTLALAVPAHADPAPVDHGTAAADGATPGPGNQPFLICQPTERDGQIYLDQCDWFQG